MKIKNQQDFYSGVMFIGVGAAFAIGATNYSFGTGGRMGPGYFPMLLGLLLVLGGLVVLFGALTVDTKGGGLIGRIAWRPLALIIGANLVFGLLLGGLPTYGIPAFGLLAAIYALVIIASKAGSQFSIRSALLLATVLAIGSYLTFIVGLSLQFQFWPSFISG